VTSPANVEMVERSHARPMTGAERLMRALVRAGLDRGAIPRAVALVVALEREAQERREAAA
jgi:hypothetical protein